MGDVGSHEPVNVREVFMLQPFRRAATLFAGAAIAIALTAPAGALTTPPDQYVKMTRHGFSPTILIAEVDGPRCRNRRNICRRYLTDSRAIRCLERFGCFTGPGT